MQREVRLLHTYIYGKVPDRRGGDKEMKLHRVSEDLLREDAFSHF